MNEGLERKMREKAGFLTNETQNYYSRTSASTRSLFERGEQKPAFIFGHFGFVGTTKECSFEQLYTNNCKHKLQHKCDQHNVADCFHGNNNTLHNVLQRYDLSSFLEVLSDFTLKQRRKYSCMAFSLSFVCYR